MRTLAFGALSLLLAAPALAAPDLVRDMTPLESFARNVARGGAYAPGELLITARATDSLPSISGALEAKRCKLVRTLGKRPLALYECARSNDMFALMRTAQALPGVRWVEASYYEQEEAMPNDLDTRQWYHVNSGQRIDGRLGRPGADIGSADAWDITTGDQRRVILINDVGIYTEHVDLRDQIWVNEDEDCENGVDDDGNGYVDDCRGFDFADDDNDPDPSSLPELKESGSPCLRWHASMIAGLAGARGDNGEGITGVNWNVSFMNVKKHRDSSCVSTTSRSIESVLYAADNGADVVSMSFSSSNYNATFEAALQEAARKGVVAVSSGGNGGRNNDTLTRYPNEYDVDASIIIGNSNHLDAMHEGANYGANSIDIAGPGTYVMSTTVDSPFAFSFGTGSSYSAGFAAGAVALVRSAFPDLTALEVADAIKDGAERVETLDCSTTPRCVRLGARIDAWGALAKAAEVAPAELQLDELRIEEQGDGDGVLEAGEVALLVPVVSNSGRGGAFLVQASLTEAQDTLLSIDRSQTSLGHIGAGQSNQTEGLEALAVSVPSDCAAPFDAELQVGLTDRFGRTWSGAQTLSVSCEAPTDPGNDNNNAGASGGDLDAEGCTSTSGEGLVWGLFGLFTLFGLAVRRRSVADR